MVKVYNGSKSTYLLIGDDGATLRIPHSSFAEIDDKFLGDITYRAALAAGELTPFETARQGDAAEKKAKTKKAADAK